MKVFPFTDSTLLLNYSLGRCNLFLLERRSIPHLPFPAEGCWSGRGFRILRMYRMSAMSRQETDFVMSYRLV